MDRIVGIMGLVFYIGSLVIAYKYSQQAFAFLAVVMIVQLIAHALGDN